MKKTIFSLIIFIFITELAGLVGSVFTFPAIPAWYAGLIKPSFSPPNWLFGPVWTILYAMMGIAVYIVWVTKAKQALKKSAIAIFAGQMILNVLWSVVFFGLRSPMLGLVVIILLWVMILATIIKFYKVSRTSAYLLLPYLVWVSFATLLNLAIVLLN